MSKDIILNVTGKTVVDKEDVYISATAEIVEKLNKLTQFKSTPYGDSIAVKCDKYLKLVSQYCKTKEELKNFRYCDDDQYYIVLVDVPNFMVGTFEQILNDWDEYKNLVFVYPHYNKAGEIRANIYVG